MKKTMVQILSENFIDEIKGVKKEQEVISDEKKEQILESVNKVLYDTDEIDEDNYPYFIETDDDQIPLNCIDCMKVEARKGKLKEEETTDSIIL